MPHDNEWLLLEIATGLQKLSTLSLDRTPAAEILVGTAGTWLEVLTFDRVWDEARDAPRVRAAFITLARTREAWPAPKLLIEALPPSKQVALEAPREISDSPELRAVMAGADPREVLGITELGPEAVSARRSGLDAAEQELRQHYGTDGKAAAAGPDA